MSNKNSLNLLDKLIKDSNSRSENLLKPHDNSENWHYCAPSCFNEQLDIKQTDKTIKGKKSLVWTQGRNFGFKAGQILYNHSDGYKSWAIEKTNFTNCIQINSATSAVDSNPFFAGSVNFIEYARAGQTVKKKELYSLTQVEFVRFLISGEIPKNKATLF